MGNTTAIGTEAKLGKLEAALRLVFPKPQLLENDMAISSGNCLRGAFRELLERSTQAQRNEIALAIAKKGVNELPKGIYHTSKQLGDHVLRCGYMACFWGLNDECGKAIDALQEHLTGRPGAR